MLVPGLPDGGTKGAAVRDAAVDGFVLHGCVSDDPLVAATVARRLPTVAVDSPMLDGVDFIGIDDGAAAGKAVRHLIALGHRELGLLSFPLAEVRDSVARRRVAGSLRAVAAAGLGRTPCRVQPGHASSVEVGRAAAHALLDRAPMHRACSRSATRSRSAPSSPRRERGLAVPGDLSIVGFDGTAPAAEGLTSVHQPQRGKGRLAADRLVAALGGDPPPPRRELLPTRLVLAATTAPPRRR